MSSSGTSSLPFRSKKKPHLNNSDSKPQSPKPNQLSSKTPEKNSQIPRRARNSGTALSLKEIRKVAERLQESNRVQQHDPIERVKSARRQITMSAGENMDREKNVLNRPTKLLEKYQMLVEFFDSLDSSIRLLRLKSSMPTFTNIFPKIECLTDRRFTHGHLAQLKFILPEVIEIKKVLVFDERTSCMKPDLHVTVNSDALHSDKKLTSECGNMSVRKFFRAQLTEFLESHPEGNEIPEEMLPEPFNRLKKTHHPDTMKVPSSLLNVETSTDGLAAQPPAASTICIQANQISDETLTAPIRISNQVLVSNINNVCQISMHTDTSFGAVGKQQPVVATHVSQSFRRRFSQRSISKEADNAQQSLPEDSFLTPGLSNPEPSLKRVSFNKETRSHLTPGPSKLASSSTSGEKGASLCASPACFTPSGAPAGTTSKGLHSKENGDGSFADVAAIDSTPVKLTSTPSRLMTVTPVLQPPKRCYMSPGNDASSLPNKLVRRPSRSRSLKFDTPVKNEKTENEVNDAGGITIDDDILDILPENLLRSIMEKERLAIEERNPAISQAKRRQKMIASLPKLFNMIHLLFHSINRSIITKEELIHKIISSHCDIIDRREVEERLNLLIELVPEWISEKQASTGDSLFCVNKMTSPDSIRSQLEEAK
ncbi:CDT1-like protein a, chloroplastic [Quillaja saponaria]|uniref:CDT1-like protein a, chloroplastic n=1 Tax=Quillaja saponaria TaxID=32244 RepID=A0AAD7Q9C2_QUISA|nr:CDT1-like protein a, chloroplastic [Quillaja saponaria]